MKFFECPLCGMNEQSFHKAFQLYELDNNIKCFGCKKATNVKHWKCPCSKPWYTCDEHNFVGATEGQSKKSKCAQEQQNTAKNIKKGGKNPLRKKEETRNIYEHMNKL